MCVRASFYCPVVVVSSVLARVTYVCNTRQRETRRLFPFDGKRDECFSWDLSSCTFVSNVMVGGGKAGEGERLVCMEQCYCSRSKRL